MARSERAIGAMISSEIERERIHRTSKEVWSGLGLGLGLGSGSGLGLGLGLGLELGFGIGIGPGSESGSVVSGQWEGSGSE